MQDIGIQTLIGKTLTSIRNSGDEVLFVTDKDETYRMYHDQDCCESVSVEDIVGDLNDLLNTPILNASEDQSQDRQVWEDPNYYRDSFTWTFYNLATIKGYVTIRWYGSSNGEYSESVDFVQV